MGVNRHRTLQLIQDGLVLYLPLDEGSGTVVYDESGNLNDGTVYGATWVDGKYGKALNFDGTDDEVNCGSQESLDDLKTFTWEAWVKPTSTFPESLGIIISKYYKDFSIDKNTLSLYSLIERTTTNAQSITNEVLSWDVWSHVVAVYKDGIIKIYKDGVECTYSTQTAGVGAESDDSAYDLKIGHYRTGNYYFKGVIDEVRIYNRALTQDEITILYNDGICSERVGVLDSKLKSKDAFKTRTDFIGLLDSKLKQKAVGIIKTELLGIKDLTVGKFKTVALTFIDKLGVLDSFVRTVSLHRIFIELLGLKDTRSKFKEAYHSATELLGLEDSKEKHKTIHKIITEYLGIIHRILAIQTWANRSKYWNREHPKQRIRINP